jgi:glycosyltransferase involved in cell wall biosynthesis
MSDNDFTVINMIDFPLVSIIVPMYNSSGYIEQCLNSLIGLDYPQEKKQIIVVDNGSSDGSTEIVKKIPVTLVSCPEGNISKVRNVGAKVAKGDFFAFVDSDCTVLPNWLKVATEILNRPNIVATGSGYKAPIYASWIEKTWLIESKIEERYVSFIPCGNFIVTAQDFESVGGFDETLVTCEDSDICERLVASDKKIINSTKLESIHLRNPKTIAEFLHKEIWYGLNMTASLNNKIFDKVFWATVLFYFAHLLILLGFVDQNTFFVGCLILLFVVNASVIRRLMISRKFCFYFHLILLYYIYFLARGIGMIKGFIKKR